MRCAHAAIEAGGDAEGMAEGAGEGFERSVIGVESDFGDGELRAGQLPCRPFEEQPPAHSNRGLVDQGAEDAIELRAAAMRAAGERAGIRLAIERIENDLTEPLCFIHTRKIPLQSGRPPDRESQNSSG